MFASRTACLAVDSTVWLRLNALPRGFSRLIGRRTASSSMTWLGPPSSAKSSRAPKMCWWNGAPRPGAISEAKRSSRIAEVNTMPVALASNSMVPSRYRYQ